jgi:hypothetical protein
MKLPAMVLRIVMGFTQENRLLLGEPCQDPIRRLNDGAP